VTSRRGPGRLPSGIGRLHAFDFEESKRVFAVCGTSTRVLALHEQVGAWGAAEPFYHVVESPYEDFDDDFTRLPAREITLDRGSTTAAWRLGAQRAQRRVRKNSVRSLPRSSGSSWAAKCPPRGMTVYR
jgi:hypothetical protein